MDGRSTPSEESDGEFKASTVASSPLRDSASNNSSLSSYCVGETFGILFVVVEVDIGTLARCSAPPEGSGLPGCTRFGKCGSGKNHRWLSILT